MGVTGLWRLLEPTGRPVPVETLQDKVLAVDISIWLHQVVKGYQDARGAPLPNAHLMGLFQRLCKLLYFRIKPVFVFDGAYPDLKKETIAKRQDSKSKYNSESERLKREILLLLSKKTAIGSLLGKETSPKKGAQSKLYTDDDDIFKLPTLPQKEETTESESDEETSSGSIVDLHSIDLESENFKNMPVKEKYDLLVEMKETRKMNSWGKLHELPKKSDNFSDFQMQRLLKRRKLQECIDETEKEIGGNCMSLNELENLLNEDGIDTKIESLPTHRIASNETTRFILIKDVKQALAEAKKLEEKKSLPNEYEKPSTSKQTIENEKTRQVDEFEEDLKKAIQMSMECNTSTTSDPNSNVSKSSRSDDSMNDSFMLDSEYSDTDEDDFLPSDMSSAKAYIAQYSDFTSKAIEEIICRRKSYDKEKTKPKKIDVILKELDVENAIITDQIEISDGESEEPQSVISEDLSKSAKQDTVNVTKKHLEESILYVENSPEKVIHLDSSIENSKVQSIPNSPQPEPVHTEVSIESTSNSSDEEFEEVPIENNKVDSVVIPLNIDLEKIPDDDIFADVFKEKENDNNSSEIDTRDNGKNDNSKECRIISKPIVTNYNLSPDLSNEEVVSVQDKPFAKLSEHTNFEQKELSNHELNDMVESLEAEQANLVQEKARMDRIGRNITEQMTKEVQELLHLFGIPYIVAPMEAEAQCAFLESVNLTDGTITDDSDIWLFGGKTVYKNFFNQKKHVLQFQSDRIEKSFNLNREQLILLALLVGSDYTTGVNGVGPVTALEILASFPYNKKNIAIDTPRNVRYTNLAAGLLEFKKWVKSGKRTDNTVLKKKLRNVDVADDFPSIRVMQAYFEPNIEKSKESFTWGDIDITVLRDYTKTKFGWSQNKLDEIIKPVIKRLLERNTQKTLLDYFKRKVEITSLDDQMSKRVKAAVQKMAIEDGNINEKNVEGETSKPKRKRKVAKQSKAVSSKKNSDHQNETTETESQAIGQTDSKKSKTSDSVSNPSIQIPKLDRYQEIIPQREKEREHVLQNKLKAIEIFRKTKIDKKRNYTKRKVIRPKDKAELSETESD